MSRVVRAAALAAACAFSSGCASQAGFGRARTLAPGNAQVTGTFETNAFLPRLTPDKVTPVPWVEVGLGYRRGVAEGVEVDLRAWGLEVPYFLPGHFNLGAGADTKLQLVRSSRFDLAVAGSVAYDQLDFGGTPTYFFTGTVPVLAGFNMGRNLRHQLVVGPRIVDTIWTSEGQNTMNLVWYGGSIGISLWNVDRYIMPELIVVYTPVSFNGEYPGRRRGLYSTQFGFSVSWDLP